MMYEFWKTFYLSILLNYVSAVVFDKHIIMYKYIGFTQIKDGFWATLFHSIYCYICCKYCLIYGISVHRASVISELCAIHIEHD